jgi:ABC-type multidrug transport system fused ATPase/permease subunit
MDVRQKELNLKIVTFLLNSTIVFVNQFSSGFLPVATFWAYTMLAGKELRIDVAFPALELFSLLQDNLREIPNLITVLLNAYVAVGRLEDFMSEPEKADESSYTNADDNLELRNASFAWPGVEKNVLHRVSLSFPTGLTVIFGQVASGKTALLQALLGELDLRDGELIKSDQPIAYCSQTPWLQSMSIRDNILFFSPLDEARYKATLEACELTTDLGGFQHGDLSPIGENGIGLSGGQKARVALARAVYSVAKTVFLDDPLSALDQHTAETIVAKLFRGNLLKDRTVLLVTHRTDLTSSIAKQVVELVEGRARILPTDYFNTNATKDYPPSLAHGTSATMETVDSAIVDAAVPEKFEEEEHRAHGGIQAAVYWEYMKAGKLRWWLVLALAGITFRILLLANSWLLKEWGEAYKHVEQESRKVLQIYNPHQHMHIASNSTNPLSRVFEGFPDPAENVRPWLFTFFIIVVAYSVIILVRCLIQLVVQYQAGCKLFRDILERVSQSTFRFYDVTPIGRLMNRLTSDIGTIDGNLSWQLDAFSWQSITWIASLIVIASVTPLFVLVSLLLTIAFVIIFLQFLPASQSLRRLEVSCIPLRSKVRALTEVADGVLVSIDVKLRGSGSRSNHRSRYANSSSDCCGYFTYCTQPSAPKIDSRRQSSKSQIPSSAWITFTGASKPG